MPPYSLAVDWYRRGGALPLPMRKTFPLAIEGKNSDRVLDAVKHEIRKYIKRERRRVVPEGMDYWDFDCRVSATQDAAETVHLSALIGQIDAIARDGGTQAYVEILAKPARRVPRPPGSPRTPADVLQDTLDKPEDQ